MTFLIWYSTTMCFLLLIFFGSHVELWYSLYSENSGSESSSIKKPRWWPIQPIGDFIEKRIPRLAMVKTLQFIVSQWKSLELLYLIIKLFQNNETDLQLKSNLSECFYFSFPVCCVSAQRRLAIHVSMEMWNVIIVLLAFDAWSTTTIDSQF